MFRYTRRGVNIISLLITIPVFLMVSKIKIFNNDFDLHLISNFFKRNIVSIEMKSNNINQDTKEEILRQYNYSNLNNTKEIKWKITIPKISLEAEIYEGTGKEVMDEYVGHFEETSLKSGNIGLAAHNRGYAVNYFAQIKILKPGDEIIYKYYDFEKTYVVSRNIIITDENWDVLENTEDNIITLITCIENQPQYRRCVQAVEKQGG